MSNNIGGYIGYIKRGFTTDNIHINSSIRIGGETPLPIDISFNNIIYAIKYSSNDNSIYVGGDFNTVLVNGITTNNLGKICRISLDDGSVNNMNGGLNGNCNTIAIDSSDNVYVGGNFTDKGNFIAKWNPSTSSWSTLGTGLNNGLNGQCRTIAIDSKNNVYAGGDFIDKGKYIAKWNPTSSWSALSDGLNNTCFTIAIDSDDNVYAGGSFTKLGNEETDMNRITKWKDSIWSPLLEGGINNGLNATCRTIAIDNDDNVYAGGAFTDKGSQIAKWTPNTSSWSELGTGLNGQCRTIAIDRNGNLYVGGFFTKLGDEETDMKKIAKWNPTTSSWSALSDGLNGIACYTIAIDNLNNVYAGGQFTIADNKPVGNFGYYSDDIWTNVNKLLDSAIIGIKGNSYIDGNVNITGKLTVVGNKTFIIDHPIYNDKYLVHACLEGPESGVYYRGTDKINKGDKKTIIKLPEYVSLFTKDLQVIVSLIVDDEDEEICNIYASRVEGGIFSVYRSRIIDNETKFNWIVTGKRGDIIVEPYKNEINVKGEGPYKYYESL
jgi:hypothetical protein